MTRESKRFLFLLMTALSLGLPALAVAAADQENQDIIPIVIDALRSNDAEMQSGVMGIVRSVPGPQFTKALIAELPKLSATGQVQLLSALGDRGDAAALP